MMKIVNWIRTSILLLFLQIMLVFGFVNGLPEPCKEGTKYPDISSCLYYLPCLNGALGSRTECKTGSGMCSNAGEACVFDFRISECVHPNPSFVCGDYNDVTDVAQTTSIDENISMDVTVDATTTPDDGLSGGAIAGIVILVVAVIAGTTAGIIVFYKKYWSKRNKTHEVGLDDM